MGFGFRIAPGVRVYPRSRGLGVGLRAGRVSYYTRAGGSGGGSVRRYQTQLRAAQKEQEIQAIAAADEELLRIASAHKRLFPQAAPPQAAPAEEVDLRPLEKKALKDELKGVPLFNRAERRAAKERARQRAAEQAAHERIRREAAREAEQQELAAAWDRLLSNEPDTVLASLEEAFADNEAPAAAVGCAGSRVDVVVRWPQISEVVGERKVALTPAGNPTHRKRSQKERNELYLEAMASNLLATAKEVFAVAPNIDACGVLCVRGQEDPAYGDVVAEIMFAGVLPRAELGAMNWSLLSPIAALEAMPEGRLGITGKSMKVRPVDVSDDPEATAAVGQVAAALGWRNPFTPDAKAAT